MKNKSLSWVDWSVQNIDKESISYPKNLLALNQPPKQLFYRGELTNSLLERSIAIVGSRRMTRYGASVIDKFVSHFVHNGITTISGYMYGVDTEVHAKTVEYGGKTVAVMGGGINTPYPPENNKLYTKVLQTGGVVMSEYDSEAKPKLWMYPQRNRIVAALATIGVLVIEAAENSGSLITVEHALKLEKKIFAVPGPITSSVSFGTNYLIKKGLAQMVTTPDDIVKENTKLKIKKGELKLSGIEREIYNVLRGEEMSIDEISMAVKKDIVEISTAVSMMALRGDISETGGKYYVVV